jgi:hypothetical protein
VSEEIFAANATTRKFSVQIDSAGNLAAYDKTGTNQLAIGTTALVLDTTYKLGIKVGTGASGAWAIQIDDVAEISGTGDLDALNNNNIQLGKAVDRNGGSVDFYYDDVLIRNDAFSGQPVACGFFTGTADGSAITWTIGAGAGARWELLDEVPADDLASYIISTRVIGDANLVTGIDTSVISTALSIGCLKTGARCKAPSDAFGLGIYQQRIRSNSANANSIGLVSQAGIWEDKQFLSDIDPGTSNPYAVADMGAIEFGVVEALDIFSPTYCTVCYLFIYYVPDEAQPPPIVWAIQPIIVHLGVPKVTFKLRTPPPAPTPPTSSGEPPESNLPAGQGNCGGVDAWQVIVS